MLTVAVGKSPKAMMRVTTLMVAVLAMITSPAGQCPSKSPLTNEEKLRIVAGDLHPKLSLQDAMKIAENFTAAQKIDLSQFWLYRAQFILFGDSSKPDTEKVPGWHFWWVSNSGGLGNYVEIFVSMDGDCLRLASM